MATCPTCGQSVPSTAPDDQIVRALDFTTPGKRGPMPAQLYAAADSRNPKISDLSQWYITGPSTREGWIKGPISRCQVEALARAGKVAPDLIDRDGTVVCYALPLFARREVLP